MPHTFSTRRSSDLPRHPPRHRGSDNRHARLAAQCRCRGGGAVGLWQARQLFRPPGRSLDQAISIVRDRDYGRDGAADRLTVREPARTDADQRRTRRLMVRRSVEQTSELQSLIRSTDSDCSLKKTTIKLTYNTKK